jgi:hypothetical protein
MYPLQKWEHCRARLIAHSKFCAAVNTLIERRIGDKLMEMIPFSIDKVFNVLHYLIESRVVAAFWASQRSCPPFSYVTSHKP